MVTKFRPKSISEIREERGLTKYKFSEMIKGTSHLTAKWEKGDVVPGTTYICRMCDAFGKPPGFFLSKKM